MSSFLTDVTHYWVFGCPSAYWYISIRRLCQSPIQNLECRISWQTLQPITLCCFCVLPKVFPSLRRDRGQTCDKVTYRHSKLSAPSRIVWYYLPTNSPSKIWSYFGKNEPLIWKKTENKCVQLVRGSFLLKYFLQNPYFNDPADNQINWTWMRKKVIFL